MSFLKRTKKGEDGEWHKKKGETRGNIWHLPSGKIPLDWDLTTYLHNQSEYQDMATSGLSCLCQSDDSRVRDQLKLLASFALNNSQAANSSSVGNSVYTSDAATIYTTYESEEDKELRVYALIGVKQKKPPSKLGKWERLQKCKKGYLIQ